MFSVLSSFLKYIDTLILWFMFGNCYISFVLGVMGCCSVLCNYAFGCLFSESFFLIELCGNYLKLHFYYFWVRFYLLFASTKICLLLITILTWTSFLWNLINRMNTNMNNFPSHLSLLVRVYIYSSFPWLPCLFSYFSVKWPLSTDTLDQ